MASASSSSSAGAKTLFAYDGSGSTGNSVAYHRLAQEIYTSTPTPNAILFWDNAHRVITPAELKAINDRRQGYGGTDSAQIARYVLANNFHGHLVLVTDGQVSVSSVDACAAILGPAWAFESVTVHLIDTGGVVNMSVSCPFTRRSPHSIYVYKQSTGHERVLETQVSAADFGVINQVASISTLAEFNAVASTLEAVVRAATMGTTGDPALRDNLLAMKARIGASQAALMREGTGATITTLTASLSVNCVVGALDAAKKLTDSYYAEADAVGWSAAINRLVSMTEGALRGAFDLSAVNAAIHSDAVRRAGAATEVPATAATATEPDEPLTAETAPFVCPVTLDAEADVVLLIKAIETPLLAGLDKDVVAKLIECPLNALNFPEVVARFYALADHPLSLRALKEAEAAGAPITTSPLTRAPLAGAICFGSDASHVNATNWTLARAITGGKRVGNADLWYAVLWSLLRRHDAPAHLAPLRAPLDAHMKWRLVTSTSSLALTGQPELPTIRVPLAAAVWYVLASPALALPPKREAFRAHTTHLGPLFEMIDLMRLPLPEGIAAYDARLRALTSLLWAAKGPSNNVQFFHNMIGVLIQAAISVDRVSPVVLERESLPTGSSAVKRIWIPIDGPASADQIAAVREDLPAAVRDLPISEIQALWDLAYENRNKSIGDIALPFDGLADPGYVARVSWPYGTTAPPSHTVDICPATCRPYLHCKSSGTAWEACATALYGPTAFKHPSNEFFGRFVEKYGAYPTKAEFLVFVFNRLVRYGTHKTLPAAEMQFVDEVFTENADVMATITPATYVARWTESRTRTRRAEMEAAAATA